MGAEDGLVEIAIEMIRYAHAHSFQGKTQKADLLGFCELNNQYARLERKMHATSRNRPPLADTWDAARNKITTYVSNKAYNRHPDDCRLAEAFLMVTEPYLLQTHEKVQLRKAL